MRYADFLARKAQLDGQDGFAPTSMPDFLFPFQRALVEWAVQMGRGALFADCGLGKTPMQLVWAENVHRHTGRPVLLLTPLAVALQTESEAEKFGIEAAVSRDGSVVAPITVTNYERLHHFEPTDFAGVVCDESSAIKAFDGARRAMVTEFLRKLRYRLLCTATAAPNDYIELGTWRQYASAFWDDVRLDRVLPFREARDQEDEKHVHPLQLDVIERCLALWSNPAERVLTPFMGVGSEIYAAVRNGRLGVGVELKQSYYRQAIKNLKSIGTEAAQEELLLDSAGTEVA